MPKSIYDIINDSTDLNKAFMGTLQPLSPLATTPMDYATGDQILSQPPAEPTRAPASLPESAPMNPMVKQALMAKMAAPSTMSQNVPVVPQQPSAEEKAQADYEAGKVNPWAVFASGVGQAMAGRAPDRSWADAQNKLVYDQTLGKLALANKEAEDKRRFDAELAFKNKSLAEQIASRKELAQMAMANKGAEKQQKTQQTMNEIEDRRQNINTNLNQLKSMIAENGTYELFGSHNQDMDRLLDQVATDMAKLQDPNSVARPSEVEAVKRTLIKPGLTNSNATALEILNNFENEVNRRADSAYKIRGLEAPGGRPQAMDSADQQAIAWAKQNSSDPRAKQILKLHGM